MGAPTPARVIASSESRMLAVVCAFLAIGTSASPYWARAFVRSSLLMDRSDLRPGEVAVTLPETFDAQLYFIGRIRTPWIRREDCPKNARESPSVCALEVDERWAPALADVETCSHLWVLYWMDQARRDLVIQAPRHYETARGTFSLRSPVRPNPIAASVVRLIKRQDRTLSVIGLDCRDGTPLLDIKPYYASLDAEPAAVVGHTGGRADQL